MNLSQAKTAKASSREVSPTEFLHYTRHVDTSTIKTRKDQYIRILELEGQFVDTVSNSEINSWHISLNTTLMGLATPRVALWSYMLREKGGKVPNGIFSDNYSREFNDRYIKTLSGDKTLVNRFFVAIVLGQEGSKVERKIAWFNNDKFTSQENRELKQEQDLDLLNTKTQALLSSLKGYKPRLLEAYMYQEALYSEPKEFLSRLYNGYWSRRPITHQPINQVIGTCRIVFGKEVVELRHGHGSQMGGIIGISEYPDTSSQGFINTLSRLDFPLVVAQSFTFQAKADSLKDMRDQIGRFEQVGDEAFSQHEAITDAIDDVVSGRIAMGHHNLSVATYSDIVNTKKEIQQGLQKCNIQIGEIISSLGNAGIIAVRESLVAQSAWWAQFPGIHDEIPRASLISTRNFSGFSSLHGESTGTFDNNHWGECVTALKTASGSLYHMNFHQADVGSTGVFGMSGSGKTVLISHFASQSRKYSGLRQIFFDKDRGMEIFIRAIGGHYSSVKRGIPTSWNPLQMEPTHNNVDFMKNWIKSLAPESVTVTADDEATIDMAIDILVSEKVQVRHRRLSTLIQALDKDGKTSVTKWIKPWLEGNRYGWVFDNPEDLLDMTTSDVMGFDITEWIDDPALRGPIMTYLLYRTRQLVTGEPLQVFIDEAAKPMNNKIFAEEIMDWLLTLRKQNAMVVLVMQSPASIMNLDISKTVIQQLATLILPSNPAGTHDEYVDFLGLNELEFSLFRSIAKGSHRFLIKTVEAHDSVIAELDLSNLKDDIAVLSGTRTNIELLDKIREEVGDNPDYWLPIFHQRRSKI